MFDLISGDAAPISRPDGRPAAGVCAVHSGVLAGVILIPLLFATEKMPVVPTMMAFVASPVAPPPPPPPPPPKAPAHAPEAKPAARQASNPNAAPMDAPAEIRPEPAFAGYDSEGVEGGIEGGVAGGSLGGFVGGLVDALPRRHHHRRRHPRRSSPCGLAVSSLRPSCCAASSRSIRRSPSWRR